MVTVPQCAIVKYVFEPPGYLNIPDSIALNFKRRHKWRESADSDELGSS